MLGFKTFLTEEVYKWRWTEKKSFYITAEFTTSHGFGYRVIITNPTTDLTPSVSFTSKEGRGSLNWDSENVISIISTVIDIVQSWVKKNKPERLSMTYADKPRKNIFDKKLKLKGYTSESPSNKVTVYTRVN